MSVDMMSMVFKRYPNGGGEMILALALADHAHEDGTRIFPSVRQLATKTRQSERAVQYQLRRMQQMGWLIRVNEGHGGRGMHSEYRIDPGWIKGADIAPGKRVQPETEKGADEHIKGATSDGKGAKLLHPHITVKNHPEPSGLTVNALAPLEDLTGKAGAARQEALGILEYLNVQAGRSFKPADTRSLGFIAARLNEGATPQECRTVIDFKVRQWKHHPEMSQYLRPETLFRPGKFPAYLQAALAEGNAVPSTDSPADGLDLAHLGRHGRATALAARKFLMEDEHANA